MALASRRRRVVDARRRRRRLPSAAAVAFVAAIAALSARNALPSSSSSSSTIVVSSFSLGGWPTSTTAPFSSSVSSLPPVGPNPAGRATKPRSVRGAPALSMVVERLSDDAVSAVSTSQLESARLGLTELTNEMLLVGAVARPERAAGTLRRFGIGYESVRRAAIDAAVSPPGGIDAAAAPPRGGGGGGDATSLPFGASAKATLNDACSIADRFASKTVRTEHVLLALLEYNYGTAAARNADGVSSDCPALNVLLKTEGLIDRDNFDAFGFCDALLDDLLRLPEPEDEGGDDEGGTTTTTTTIEEEVVVVGGVDPGSTPTLNEVGLDLTALAAEGKLDVVYGRNDEIRMCLRTLGRRRKNNPCLIGEPGVGKTAVAEGVAQVIAGASASASEGEARERKVKEREGFNLNPFKQRSSQELQRQEEEATAPPSVVDGSGSSDLPPCPKCLLGHRVVSVELASLVAGTRNRGDFEERVQKLVREVASTPTILFVDEIHAIIGTGGSGDGGGTNAANLLKPALARGDLRILGATTTPEYRKHIEKDAALERRFQPITVKEPTVEETLDILEAVAPKYEDYHDVMYRRNALEAAAKMSDRYLNDRFLPDKAIDLIDEAGSMIKMDEDLTYDPDDPESIALVTEDDVAKVVSELSGIPVGKLETGEKERLRNIEAEMKKRIKGQDRAVRAVAKSIRRARSGLRDGRRPIASFMFCGPTGVGKTELCKSLAETYYGREKDMIRIDMSEYMERHTTSRLVGSPPGYVGYDEGGQLTEAVRRAPHSVVLLDELEKAHEDVLNVLLQIMDEGQLTDGKGRTVSFKNCVFVMTSNVGSQKILQMSRGGAGGDDVEEALAMASVVKEELEKTMKPELLNRIDEIVVFSPLGHDDLLSIAKGLINEIVQRAYAEGKMTLSVTDRLVQKVTEEGCRDASKFGARPMRRSARSYLEDTVAEAIMSDFLTEGDEVVVDLADALEVPGGQSELDRGTVKITKVASGTMMESKFLKVEDDAGIGNVEDSEWDAAANRPIPETFFE